MSSVNSKSNSTGHNDNDYSNDVVYDDDELGVVPYAFEPLATAEEAAEYEQYQICKKHEDQKLAARFNKELDLNAWCKCGNCSLESIVKPNECWCCADIEKCMEKMNNDKLKIKCITEHPGFDNICLNPHVLRVAALGLKTSINNKKYTTIYEKGLKTETELLQAVSYRQLLRLIWDATDGYYSCYRLPSCAYSKIRKAFPSVDFKDFEAADDYEDSDDEDSDDEDSDYSEDEDYDIEDENAY